MLFVEHFSIVFKRLNYHILFYYITIKNTYIPIESWPQIKKSCLANQCGETEKRNDSRVASLIELKMGLSI